jgi:putative membrane protein
MRSRKIILLAAPALVFALAFGCKKNESANTDTAAATTDTSTSSASTSVSSTDTSGTTTTNPTTSTTSTAPVALADDDKKFAMKAAEGGLGEVNLGGIAASKATNADVKSFGQRMQTDHGKAGDELKQWASTKGFDLPTQPNAETQKAATELSAKSGAAFDKAYMEDMVKDHDKDVKEFQEASKKVKDPDLKSWIDKTLPVVQDHDKMAHDIAKKLK